MIEIKVPTPGESITEVEIGKWIVADGDLVEKDQELGEVESDKATLTLSASESGQIKIIIPEGERAAVGAIACTIDTSKALATKAEKPAAVAKVAAVKEVAAPAPEKVSAPEVVAAPEESNVKVTSVAKKMMEEYHLSMEDVLSGLHRISKGDIEAVLASTSSATGALAGASVSSVSGAAFAEPIEARTEKREKMTSLRRKLSQRLVAVKNETAMLTTFNEIDMSRVMEMRSKLQTKFVEKYGLKLGFMSLFSKAVAEAMQFHPAINAQIDGEEIITPDFVDIGIAVQTPKGLMVPIIRNCESKTIAAIEIELKVLAEKARSKKISVEELTGGTFTITNGGTFGSLLSTPIINPPQSAILGMHNIVDRPVAVNGLVVIRPMMYVALSYDHRIIDGKDSVGFLVKVKELIENPERLLTNGRNPEEVLLGL
ncbi:MAG: 2-oxoglutarate dehydrogenase complex dihydrolipoyllysine-residue succinyltransferase [Prolixibacteraceae bacterium]|nr:2-oxoglutarate dehydrogenase complex dihydrolipoyllysine-residue succinyltransferase [Prolixibacteraceae bacterium]